MSIHMMKLYVQYIHSLDTLKSLETEECLQDYSLLVWNHIGEPQGLP